MPNLIPIRLSHLLAHSGVGAIVHGPNDLVVVRDVREWTDKSGQPGGAVVYATKRVCDSLGVKALREPPKAPPASD